jgi:hypothetical protein
VLHLGMLWPYLNISLWVEKSFPGTNALAYLSIELSTKYVTLSLAQLAGLRVAKLFTDIIYECLFCLSMVCLYNLV